MSLFCCEFSYQCNKWDNKNVEQRHRSAERQSQVPNLLDASETARCFRRHPAGQPTPHDSRADRAAWASLSFGYARAPSSVAAPTIATTGCRPRPRCLRRADSSRKIPLRYANAVGATIALLLAAPRLLFIALSGDPMPTANLILTLVGAGFILLSTRWLVGVVVVTLLAWILIASGARPVAGMDRVWLLPGFCDGAEPCHSLHAIAVAAAARALAFRERNPATSSSSAGHCSWRR